jgi:hypothetical protein
MRKLLFVFTLLAFVSQPALATQSTEEKTFTFNNDEFNASLISFDTDLGTLDSLTLELLGNIGQTVSIENLKTSKVTAFVTAGIFISLIQPDSDNSLVIGDFQNSSFTKTLTATDYVAGSGTDYYSNPFAATPFSTTAVFDMTQFAGYTDTGVFALNINLAPFQTVKGVSNYEINSILSGDLKVKVTYNYTPSTPVPEPATIGFLSISAILLLTKKK